MKITWIVITLTIAIAFLCVSLGTVAYAQSPAVQITTTTGNLYRVTDYRAHCAFPECVPQRSADVTFKVGTAIPIDFDSRYSGSSLRPADWLTHSPNAAVNTVGLQNILNSDMSDFHGYGTIIVFTGSITVRTGEVFTINHDDYVYLRIGRTDVALLFSAQTDTVTYNGPSGTFPFQLTYTEQGGSKRL